MSSFTMNMLTPSGVSRVFIACMSLMTSSGAILLLGATALSIPTGVVSTSVRNVPGENQPRAMRFTIEELLHTRFPSRVSDDIDLDPCKGGKSHQSS